MATFRTLTTILFSLFGSFIMAQENNNDFYDDAETFSLPGMTRIQVTGEVEQPGFIDITTLPMRSVIVKEALLAGDTNRFTGAYRFDGYSLYDILNRFLPLKMNRQEFPPIIDLYVVVESSTGEKVMFSWGEIYYPIHRHEIIIATQVARIVPSKTNELWPLPEATRLVAGHDLLTERNIGNPVKITVRSAAKSFPVNREIQPLYSSEAGIFIHGRPSGRITGSEIRTGDQRYEAIFYGRGKGIHSTTPFEGSMLKEFLGERIKKDRDMLRLGYMVVSAIDGYRAVFSFSEVFNRNDQSEVLLIHDQDNQDGGVFRLFPAADFFSDRAVKAINGIWFEKIDD